VWRNLPSENAPLRPKKTKSSRGIECRRVSFVRKRQRRRRRRGRARVRVLDVLFLFFLVSTWFSQFVGWKSVLKIDRKRFFRGPEAILGSKTLNCDLFGFWEKKGMLIRKRGLPQRRARAPRRRGKTRPNLARREDKKEDFARLGKIARATMLFDDWRFRALALSCYT